MRAFLVLVLITGSCLLSETRTYHFKDLKLNDPADDDEEMMMSSPSPDGGGGGPPRSNCDRDLTSTGGDIRARVIEYIDAGTCDDVCPILTECSENAQSYYEEFFYKGKRVIIFAQAADHPAETNMLSYENINRRCTRWQFVQMNVNVKKTQDTANAPSTYLDNTMVFLNGVPGYNPWGTPGGDIAMYSEPQTLDECGGHSAFDGSYHYHSIPMCDKSPVFHGSLIPHECKQLAWMLDGVPVYGVCFKNRKHKVLFKSCYKVNDASTLETVSHITYGDFDVAPNQSDYTWSKEDYDAGRCNLDEAQGAIHPGTGRYSYFLTMEYPWMPLYYFGEGASDSLVSGEAAESCSAN